MDKQPDTSSPDISYPCRHCSGCTCRCDEVETVQDAPLSETPTPWPAWMAALAANA
mgnify:CR=1 FL=1